MENNLNAGGISGPPNIILNRNPANKSRQKIFFGPPKNPGGRPEV